MSTQHNIAILASGNGTNAEALIHYFQNHELIHISLLLCNNPKAYVLQRVERLGIPSFLFGKEEFEASENVLTQLRNKAVSHLVLAGFLWLIPKKIIDAFPGRIVNIHPALLPNYGGKGMFGAKVHEAVKASGDQETGITIHEVNEKYDEGEILFQEAVEVLATDTAGQIADKVHALEHMHYPRVIEKWILKSIPN